MTSIDMSAIQEALQRRLAGGGGTPALNQQSPQSAGAGSDEAIRAAMANQQGGASAMGKLQNPAAAGTAKPKPKLPEEDTETRDMAKQLVANLLKYL